MFGSRQKKTRPIEEEAVWNGWNKSVLESVNGKDRFNFQIDTLSVTNSFDGEEYASEVRLAESKLEAYNKMPLLFDDSSTGTVKEHYRKVDTNVTGLETSIKVRSDLMIVRTRLSEIYAEKRAGWLNLNGEYTEMAISGRESAIPLISATLYDPDGMVLETMRKAFFAAQGHRKSPQLRVFLRDKIKTDIEDSEKGRSYAINRFIIWESWGQQG